MTETSGGTMTQTSIAAEPYEFAFDPGSTAHLVIDMLIVCDVTTEVCVHPTVREANDRGYEYVLLADRVGSCFPEFQRVALEMVKAQGGIFDWVSDSKRALVALAAS
jgi:nicotinamidase-related amidase